MPADSRAPKNAELGGGAPPSRAVADDAPETAQARGGSAESAVAAEIVRAATEETAAPPEVDTDPAPLAAPTEPVLADDADPTLREEIPAELARPLDDEVSIPPVGDLVVEEFFSEGDVGAHLAADDDLPLVDAKIARKRAPEVVERRTRLARYVRWAVAGAGALCVVALGRGLVASRAPALADVKPANAVVALAEPPAAAAKEAPPEPAKVEPAAVVEAAKEEAAPAAAAAPPVSDDKPAVVELDPKAAAAEKATARRALESGRLAVAITAGERSVALDPTDGEAWLLLGAAQQEKGNLAEARRAYTACVKQGKRGPLSECNAMLR